MEIQFIHKFKLCISIILISIIFFYIVPCYGTNDEKLSADKIKKKTQDLKDEFLKDYDDATKEIEESKQYLIELRKIRRLYDELEFKILLSEKYLNNIKKNEKCEISKKAAILLDEEIKSIEDLKIKITKKCQNYEPDIKNLMNEACQEFIEKLNNKINSYETEKKKILLDCEK